MMRFGLTRNSNGSALPLPPNSGLPELGVQICRSRICPTSMGEGRGDGLRSLVGPAPPHPVCGVYHRAALRADPLANRPLPVGACCVITLRFTEVAGSIFCGR